MSLGAQNDEHMWELIASALQGDLSPEEETEFNQWLHSSESNQQWFEQLSRAWKDTADFAVFEKTDDAHAWKSFQEALSAKQTRKNIPAFPIARNLWLAAAFIFLVAVGGGYWYLTANASATTYETAGEQQLINLPDGSKIIMQPQTRLQLTPGFNKKDRTIFLEKGTAQFDVVHNVEKPFTVDMDAASVRDIGTRFTIEQTRDSILVSVSAGKIEFTPKAATQLSKDIGAGGSICVYKDAARAGQIRETGDLSNNNSDSLQFNNVPLSEVLTALEQRSGKSLRLANPLLGEKRLTIKLGSESLEDALRLICASMHLAYVAQPGGYILEKSDSTRRR
jgi:transmembrane sensor